jgi:hypothetical protein
MIELVEGLFYMWLVIMLVSSLIIGIKEAIQDEQDKNRKPK